MTHPASEITEIARTFPVLKQKWGAPKESIPWAAIASHERQAQRNHFQSLKQLAERGGLSWAEMLAVLEDRKWYQMDADEAKAKVLAIVAARAAEGAGG